jgi:hypothetical protein
MDAFLEWYDAVKIAFYEYRETLAANRLLRERESVQIASLRVHRGLR